MFSQTAEYALRAIVWLAENAGEGPIGNQRIAKGTQVPVTYLAKIMQGLVKANLVSSRRGVGGGFVLNDAPEDITVLDVVNAVDPINRIETCPLKLTMHKHKRCGMHSRLDQAIELVQETLAKSTIAEILDDATRPKPLKNERGKKQKPDI